MPPPPPHLETWSRRPKRDRGRPPLLFVHGGYVDGWCWTPHFLPWFADAGWAAHSLSLRGHGGSDGRDTLFATGLDDYAADVERVAASLPQPPVLIGHSMGAAVIERLLATRKVRAAALLAPVPPTGLIPVAARLAVERPDSLMQMSRLDPNRIDAATLHALRPFYFSDRVDPAILAESSLHVSVESPRALLDLSMRMHFGRPQRNGADLLVLGAGRDRISSPYDLEATARHHGVESLLVPGLAHMLMLEPGWDAVAEAIARWLRTLDT